MRRGRISKLAVASATAALALGVAACEDDGGTGDDAMVDDGGAVDDGGLDDGGLDDGADDGLEDG